MNHSKLRVLSLAGMFLVLIGLVSLLTASGRTHSAQAIDLLRDNALFRGIASPSLSSTTASSLNGTSDTIAFPVATTLPNASAFASMQAGCKCADIVLVVDDTGSMGPAINNIKAGLAAIITTANTQTGMNLRMGLVTFKHDIEVDQPLTSSIPTITTAVNNIAAGGGMGEFAASDEALRLVISGPGAVSCETPTGASVGAFRAECFKIIVLVTDNPPGGCGTGGFQVGSDDVNAINVANAAASQGIIISSVLVGLPGASPNNRIERLPEYPLPAGVEGVVMKRYADLTTTPTAIGKFVEVPSNGTGAATSIEGIIKDATPPSITCSANLIRTTDPGLCTAVTTFTVTGGDNCPGVTTVCTPPSGFAFPKGVTTVNCTATDSAVPPNKASCSFTVTVNDAQLPTPVCPANITRPADPGLCTAAVTYSTTATDNCPGVTVACTPPSGFAFPKGTTTVNCTATDAANNKSSCSFTVTVADTEPPKPVCPANITQPTDPGLCTAVVTYTATVTDNCPGATVACSPPSTSVFPKGTTTVTCTATDAASNTASCSFTVTVEDKEKPKITCPSDVNTTSCGGTTVISYPPPVATDNCPGVTTACVPPSSFAFPPGVTTVVCTATDTSSNTSTCSFKVSIEVKTCDTICFYSPQYYLLHLNNLPHGQVLIGGVNYNSPVNTNDRADIKMALQGNALGYGTLTPLQQLNQEFVAAQLSAEGAGNDGGARMFTVNESPLHAWGLNLVPVPLGNGFTITRDTLLKDLFAQARSSIFENRTADMVLLTGVFDLLNGNDILSNCGPQRPKPDLAPMTPNGSSNFCAFSGTTLRVTVKNQGDVAAPATTTAVTFGGTTVNVPTP
ncbi:MAG: HYR domain-containing protein, partial [Blastocatellia bacterium]